MKKIILIAALAITQTFATDYSSMTIDELVNSRGSITVEDKDAFRAAMKSKMSELSPEDRSSYRGSGGTRSGSQLRDGSGSGGMYKGSRGGRRR